MMKICALILSAGLMLSPCAFAQEAKTPDERGRSKIPKDISYEDDIVYKKIDGHDLKLIIFYPRPKPDRPSPVVLFIHGGGWMQGSRFGLVSPGTLPILRQLLERGVIVVSTEYRHVPANGITAYECTVDCKDALRYLVRNASRYSIDPDRIALFGSSAGGHLALSIGLSDDQAFAGDAGLASQAARVKAIATHFPLVSFVDPEVMADGLLSRPGKYEEKMGGTLEQTRTKAEKISPLLLLDAGDPPIFVAHGNKDKVLNVRNALALESAAKAAGVSVECLIVEGADHSFRGESISPSMAEIQNATTDFLLRHLLGTAPLR